MKFYPCVKPFGVGHKQVVPYKLNLISNPLCHLLPAVPVVLRKAVLNGKDGIFRNQFLIISNHFSGIPHHITSL